MKKLLKRIKENTRGFSLVELIVVIAIMAILVGVLGVTFIPYIEKSREGVDIDTLGKVKSVVEPVMLTSEDLKDTWAGKYWSVEKIREEFTIVDESLPNEVGAKCECSEDDLEAYVYVNTDGTVIAYFSNNSGAEVFADTKDLPLTTADLPENPVAGEAAGGEGGES